MEGKDDSISMVDTNDAMDMAMHVPDAMYGLMNPPLPPIAVRPIMYDAKAIERKRLAALKLRFKKNIQHLKEEYGCAITGCPCNAAAIEVKRQAAVKLRMERHLQHMAMVKRRSTPPRIMLPRTCTPSPTWDMADQDIEAAMMSIDEATLYPLPPPVPPGLSTPCNQAATMHRIVSSHQQAIRGNISNTATSRTTGTEHPSTTRLLLCTG